MATDEDVTIISDAVEVTDEEVTLGETSVAVKGAPEPNLMRELLDRLPGKGGMTAHSPTARDLDIKPAPLPAPVKRDRSHVVRSLDADASATLGARVFRLGDAVTVEWPHGYTAADQARAEALLGPCSHVGTALQPERKLDEALTARLNQAGLTLAVVSSIDGAAPEVTWRRRDPTPEEAQRAKELLS